MENKKPIFIVLILFSIILLVAIGLNSIMSKNEEPTPDSGQIEKPTPEPDNDEEEDENFLPDIIEPEKEEALNQFVNLSNYAEYNQIKQTIINYLSLNLEKDEEKICELENKTSSCLNQLVIINNYNDYHIKLAEKYETEKNINYYINGNLLTTTISGITKQEPANIFVKIDKKTKSYKITQIIEDIAIIKSKKDQDESIKPNSSNKKITAIFKKDLIPSFYIGLINESIMIDTNETYTHFNTPNNSKYFTNNTEFISFINTNSSKLLQPTIETYSIYIEEGKTNLKIYAKEIVYNFQIDDIFNYIVDIELR